MSDFHNKWREFLAEEEPFQKQMRSNLPGELDFLLNRGSNDKREGPGVKGATFPSGKSAPPLEEDMRLLREITEDELTHIQAAIDEMGPEELAFNELFQGKTRLVIDFPTLDKDSELGQFLAVFDKMDYQVDWEKGILTGSRVLKDSSVENLVSQLMGGPETPVKTRKIQMKVGKFLAKLYELASKKKELGQKVFDHLDKIGYKGQPDIRYVQQFTGKMIAAALDEQEQKRYQQLTDHLNMYVGENGGEYAVKIIKDPEVAKNMAQYWQQNADYIKKNLKEAQTSQYSIVISRDPVDILRMADFNNITSCHAPPSRDGGGSYYKCAVAEAHGHGAVAYVVDTEELLESTGTETIEGAEKYIEEYDGEIFPDEIRGSHIGLSMELQPISRVRLRQFRYDTPDPEGGYDIGVQLAVPEQRIYGKQIPGFGNRILKWAQTNQEDRIAAAPKTEDGKLNLGKFTKFGGSHGDTGRAELVARLFGIHREEAKGHLKQDTDTEDQLDTDLLSGQVQQYNQQVGEIEDEWNHRYQAAEVSAWAEEDGESVHIEFNAGMEITWDLDEWNSLPNPTSARYAISELNDIGYGWASESGASIGHNTTAHGHKVKLSFSINPAGIGEDWPNAGSWAADPEDFRDFCIALNSIDDAHDTVKYYITQHYKREGYTQGAAFYNMAMEIANRDFTSYEWDVEMDDMHDPEEAYEITATTTMDLDPEEFGMSAEVLQKIVDSRDYRVAVRTKLLQEPRETVGTEYYLDVESSATPTYGGGPGLQDITFELKLTVRESHPDVMVELLRAVIEDMDDEDVLRAIFVGTVKEFQNSRMPSFMQKPDTPQELTERKHRQTKHMYNKWRKFLCS